MKFQGTMQSKDNELYIGGVSMRTLQHAYGTPLYVMDAAHIETMCRLFKDSFTSKRIEGVIAYASKAFLNKAMAQLVAREGLSVDVASGGELYTVYKAGFPMERVYFHGNNKLDEEIQMAVDTGCGAIILDNRQEVARVERILTENKTTMDVYLRINPGIDAHTHEYIKTTKLDSKFGESIFDPDIFSIIRSIAESEVFNLRGFHCHIGSQIFEKQSFFEEAKEVLGFYETVRDMTGLNLSSMNLGGGFGVYYVEGDQPISLSDFLNDLLAYIECEVQSRNLAIQQVVIEPGRSIVCNAGSTLYTVGGTKHTYGGRDYLFVDGGMSDNPRPALYQAKYEGILANRVHDDGERHYRVAGKLCESGDVIIHDILLPQAQADDLLLVSSTGAYTYSMSSNYNRLQRPAVVFVENGSHRLVVKRQSLDDLLQWDLDL